MENLDGTVVVTALPQMAASFGVHPVDLNIGVSSYILTLAILIPASGWVADRFGARRVFAGAIVVFTLASMLCGYCNSLGAFTLARILQGAGGAMMVPVGRLAVLRVTEKHNLMRAIATITWPGLAAPVLGPPLGGFITTYASWQWIFFLNAPLGLVALILALRLIPQGSKTVTTRFDWTGFALTGLACFALMYGLDLVGSEDTSWPIVGLSLLVAIVAGVAAILHAKRQAHPLVDFRALRVRSYAMTIRGGSVFRVAIAAVPFLLPLLFQIGFGLNPFASGTLVLAVFAGNIAMKPFTTPILRRFSFRGTLLVNGLINAAVIFGCAFLTPATPVAVTMGLLFVSGTNVELDAIYGAPHARFRRSSRGLDERRQHAAQYCATIGDGSGDRGGRDRAEDRRALWFRRARRHPTRQFSRRFSTHGGDRAVGRLRRKGP